MLKPEFLETASDNLENLFRELESQTVVDISKRLSRIIDKVGKDEAYFNISSQYQMDRLDEIQGFRRDLIKRISRITKLSEKEIDKLLTEAANQAHSYDVQRFVKEGRVIPPLEKNAKFQQFKRAIIEHTKGTLENIVRTKAIGFKGLPAQQYFIRTLDRAALQVSTGVMSYDYAIRRAVLEMSESGLQSVSYGKRNINIVTAVRTATLTSVRQIANFVSLENGIALSMNIVEVSAHNGSRPTHIPLQGKRYSVNDYEVLRNTMQY